MIAASRPRTCSTCWMRAGPLASPNGQLTSLASEGWPVSARRVIQAGGGPAKGAPPGPTSGCSARGRHDTQAWKRPRAAVGTRDRGTASAVRAAGPHRSERQGHPTIQRRSPSPRDDQDSGNAPSPDALGTRVGRSPGANLYGGDGPVQGCRVRCAGPADQGGDRLRWLERRAGEGARGQDHPEGRVPVRRQEGPRPQDGGALTAVSLPVGGRSFIPEGDAVERDAGAVCASGPLAVGSLWRQVRPVRVRRVKSRRYDHRSSLPLVRPPFARQGFPIL